MIERNFETDSYQLYYTIHFSRMFVSSIILFSTGMRNKYRQSHNFCSLNSSMQMMVGMLNLFAKISKFYHENPHFLRHPIKFAVVDSSTTPDCTTKLTIKATGRIFVGAWSGPSMHLNYKMIKR